MSGPAPNLFGLHRKHLLFGWPFLGFYIGTLLDRTETNRMTKFRDKSALYGGNVKPGDPPSWP